MGKAHNNRTKSLQARLEKESNIAMLKIIKPEAKSVQSNANFNVSMTPNTKMPHQEPLCLGVASASNLGSKLPLPNLGIFSLIEERRVNGVFSIAGDNQKKIYSASKKNQLVPEFSEKFGFKLNPVSSVVRAKCQTENTNTESQEALAEMPLSNRK